MTGQVPYCVLAVPLLLQPPLWKDSCLPSLHIFVGFQLPEAFPETSCARCHKETHCLCEGHYDEQCSAGQSERLFSPGYRAHLLSLLLCLLPSFCETYGWIHFTGGTDNLTRSAGFRKLAFYRKAITPEHTVRLQVGNSFIRLHSYFLSPNIATSKRPGPVCVPIAGVIFDR